MPLPSNTKHNNNIVPTNFLDWFSRTTSSPLCSVFTFKVTRPRMQTREEQATNEMEINWKLMHPLLLQQ